MTNERMRGTRIFGSEDGLDLDEGWKRPRMRDVKTLTNVKS